MKTPILALLLPTLLCAIWVSPALPQGTPGQCLTAEEQELFDLLNAYRVQNGKQPVTTSKSLSKVAQYHVWDLQTNSPSGGNCNLHSWSSSVPPGVFWTSMCYTPDHAQAQKMWDKPKEITNNLYTGYGFEITYWNSQAATPAGAMALWENSSGHNDVMLNLGPWAAYDPWPAVGIGLFEEYACIWFGDITDPAGPIGECATSATDADVITPTAGVTLSTYPNPVRSGATTIRFVLPESQDVQLRVFDGRGRLVRQLLEGSWTAGTHDVIWNGTTDQGQRVAPGVYFYRLDTRDGTRSHKLTLVR